MCLCCVHILLSLLPLYCALRGDIRCKPLQIPFYITVHFSVAVQTRDARALQIPLYITLNLFAVLKTRDARASQLPFYITLHLLLFRQETPEPHNCPFTLHLLLFRQETPEPLFGMGPGQQRGWHRAPGFPQQTPQAPAEPQHRQRDVRLPVPGHPQPGPPEYPLHVEHLRPHADALTPRGPRQRVQVSWGWPVWFECCNGKAPFVWCLGNNDIRPPADAHTPAGPRQRVQVKGWCACV